jgi:hypothetical protein
MLVSVMLVTLVVTVLAVLVVLVVLVTVVTDVFVVDVALSVRLVPVIVKILALRRRSCPAAWAVLVVVEVIVVLLTPCGGSSSSSCCSSCCAGAGAACSANTIRGPSLSITATLAGSMGPPTASSISLASDCCTAAIKETLKVESAMSWLKSMLFTVDDISIPSSTHSFIGS